MTDLLHHTDRRIATATATDTATGDDELRARTFRAATLDDAVAAARAELGPDVELLEAHRVRRGGLGGFFATDLGVEIIAIPTEPALEPLLPPASIPQTRPAPTAPTPALDEAASPTDRHLSSTHDDLPTMMPLATPGLQPMPADDLILPVAPPSERVVTALDRLIEHAESLDRRLPVDHAAAALRTPTVADPADLVWGDEITDPSAETDDDWWNDEIDTRADQPGSFEAHLRTELGGTTSATDGPTATATASAIPALSTADSLLGLEHVDADAIDADATEELDIPDWVSAHPEEIETGDLVEVETADTVTTDLDTTDLDTTDTATTDLGTEATDMETAETDLTVDIAGDTETGADEISAIDTPTAAALAPPSALLNPQLADTGTLSELDELLRGVGISVDPIETTAELDDGDQTLDVETTETDDSTEYGEFVPPSTALAPLAGQVELADALPVEQLGLIARAATDQLVGSIAAAAGSHLGMSHLTISLTAADGSSVTVATEFAPTPPLSAPALSPAETDALPTDTPPLAGREMNDA